jgi:hypothetical protein
VTLSLGSTCSKLVGQDGGPSSWRVSVEGRQLERQGTPHLCQHRVGDLLPVAIPRHGYRGRLTTGCALVDPLGAQAIHMAWCICSG